MIGLTNTAPASSPPVLGNYAVCAQHTSNLYGDGSTSQFWCPSNLPPARFVVLQNYCGGDGCSINLGEVEVYPRRKYHAF